MMYVCHSLNKKEVSGLTYHTKRIASSEIMIGDLEEIGDNPGDTCSPSNRLPLGHCQTSTKKAVKSVRNRAGTHMATLGIHSLHTGASAEWWPST